MLSKELKVFSLCNEINLDKIATHFGINKKYRWEEFLTLKEQHLKGVIQVPDDKSAILFPFGSIVFINMLHNEIVDLVDYLNRIEKNLLETSYDFSDNYILEIGSKQTGINYDRMAVSELQDYQLAILSIVLAKSVSLDRVETNIDNLLDEVESIVNRLEKGRLSIKDEKLAKISSRILGFKFDTISYIMLLDKPDITWENEDAEKLHKQLSHLFELNDRYDKIQAKSETLMDITQVFTSLAHQKRGNRLEWMIIILITFEIFLTLFEFIFLK